MTPSQFDSLGRVSEQIADQIVEEARKKAGRR